MKGEDLVLSILRDFYGLREKDGPDSEAEVLGIINWAMPSITDDSKVAWCAIALSYFIDLYCGPFEPIKTARSFLNIGMRVKKPKCGDIVVYWRNSINSWQGHVGIVVRVDKDGSIWTLGGNQDNQVNIKSYSPSRVLGYVRI